MTQEFTVERKKGVRHLFRGMVCRSGLTLIEIIAAVAIASTVAAISIQYLRPVGTTSNQRSCDLTRQLLQNDARRYMEINAKLPSVDLRELESEQYSGPVLPVCPVTAESYARDRTGTVECPTHEATRTK